MPGLRHRLARRHGQPGVQPENGRGHGGLLRRPRIVEIGSRHLQPGEFGGPLIHRHRRVHPDLGRPLRHRDPRQRARPLPGRTARPPDYLPDASVLPGPGRRGPFTVRLGDPGVGQEAQHRPRRALKRIGPSRRRAPVNADDQRQRVLRPLIPAGILHPGRRLGGRPFFVSHPSSMPATLDRPVSPVCVPVPIVWSARPPGRAPGRRRPTRGRAMACSAPASIRRRRAVPGRASSRGPSFPCPRT